MYQRILVPIDGSAIAQRGLQEALRLATLTSARIRLLHVVDMQTFATAPGAYLTPTDELVDLLRRGGQEVLQSAIAQAAKAGVPAESVLLENLSDPVCELVVREAHEWGADLIVIGTHGRRGLGRLLLGSDAEQVLRLSPVPVLLVRTPTHAVAEAPLAAAV